MVNGDIPYFPQTQMRRSNLPTLVRLSSDDESGGESPGLAIADRPIPLASG